VHMNGMTRRSCVTPISTVEGADIVTIEGVAGAETDAVRAVWASIDVPQCGYCQSGMIMSVVALLNRRPNPTDTEIAAEVTNACRCSTYHRVRKAIRLAASKMSAGGRAL